MRIAIIAAMAKNRVIGLQHGIPWYLPADLHYFKQHTLGKAVIMGRKTFESLNKPLLHRQNIIITRNPHYTAPNCIVVHSLIEALSTVKNSATDEIMIVGGAEIYQEALPLADRMYLTYIDADIAGDTFFPAWNQDEWQEVEKITHSAHGKNHYSYSFIILDRKKSM